MSIAMVAKVAGVSQATVSRVINRRPGVSPQIIQAVRDAMGALDYRPPPLERRPGRRSPIPPKNSAVGSVAAVVLDNLYQYTPGIFASHLSGIEAEAAEHAMAMVVLHASSASKGADLLLSALSKADVRGLILMGSRGAPEVLHSLEAFPSVWLSSHHGPAGDAVLAGNHEIARLAAEYLLRRQHRNLGFLSLMSSYPAYPVRADAFRAIATRAHATVQVLMDDSVERACEHRVAEFPGVEVLQQRAEMLIDRLLACDPRPTGVFVPNDMMTAMCYVALRSRGLVPGRDIEFISCNNEQCYLIALDPRPATIDIGAELIGRRSVEQLLRKMRRPHETRSVQIAVSPVLIEPDGSKQQ